MSLAIEKLQAIAEDLKKGLAPQKETVRSFLLWFGAERRGYNVVGRIRQQLKQYGIATSPDFEATFIDGHIEFVRARPEEVAGGESSEALADPTYRLGRLDAANRAPVSVKPDSLVQQAVTLMLTHDFSQLPVMTTPREVKGVVSWKAIGSRLALQRRCEKVSDCMEPTQILSWDEPLFEAISRIAANDYALVKGKDGVVCGIVTATDLTEQFHRLAEPFLLVGEIENGIRRILHGKFTAAELIGAEAPAQANRRIESVANLSFGAYVRLIEGEGGWNKLGLAVDRSEFVSRLNKVREIRNDVMHFNPDGLEPAELQLLREFALFLKKLRDMGAI